MRVLPQVWPGGCCGRERDPRGDGGEEGDSGSLALIFAVSSFFTQGHCEEAGGTGGQDSLPGSTGHGEDSSEAV